MTMIERLLAEAASLERKWKNMGTDGNDVAQFKRITIPLVRRIYPQLIPASLVGVHPITDETTVEELRWTKDRKPVYRSIDDPWEQTEDLV